MSSKPRTEPTALLTKQDVLDKYKMGDALGKGNFSVVYRCTSVATGKEYAAKVIDKSTVLGKEAMLDAELGILAKVKHPNVVSMVESFETKESLYVIMDLVTGGELFDRIVERGSYSEQDASVLVRQLTEAIKYLHEQGIVHRDLKPENLLFADPAEDAALMITDFGLSRMVPQQTMMSTACGTPGYVAPEVLKQNGYNREVDMWSIGVILYILLCGYPPFYNDDQAALFEQIVKGNYVFHEEYWKEISDSAKDLIKKLLKISPSERLTADETLSHPWISGGEAKTVNIKDTFKTGYDRFNARRKLKGAIMSIQMINRLKKAF